MEKDPQRTLQLLTEIEKDQNISQRVLSDKLGIALGLTNACIRRCVKKGYIKITTIPKNRIKYLITPKGFSEKASLTYQYLQYVMHFYKETRKRIRDSFHFLEQTGVRDIIFYGVGDVAEISYISLRETDLTLVGIVDDHKHGTDFFGIPVMKREQLKGLSFDKVIITSFTMAEEIHRTLIDDKIGREKIFLIR